MTANQIENTFKSATKLIQSGKIKLAFDKTSLLVDELQWGNISDRFAEMKQNYRFMLNYFVEGAEDPDRKVFYNKMIAKLILLNYWMKEELLMRNSTAYEYTQKRFFPHKLHFGNTTDLFDSLSYYHKQLALIMQVQDDNHAEEIKRLRKNFEQLLPDLFNICWLNTKFDAAEKKLIKQLLDPNYPGITEKCLIISAITLNIWRMFDDEKLLILLDACQHNDLQVRQRVLVALSFILTKYDHFLPFFPQIRNRLIVLADDNRTIENLKDIILLIIGTADTDKITKKMNEEILPEVIKISPIIRSRIDSDQPFNAEDWEEENPEWQEILAKSGVSDKLQELTELQLEGADVFMSTFSYLKNFPFFSETSHWFLPFDTEFSDINQLFEENDKTIVNAFLGNSSICNSDKYSFCLSVMRMPEAQRERVSRTFKIESDQLQEISKDESILKPNLAARNIARQYIQDLFRFFRIHPQHADFEDFFNYSLSIHQTGIFSIFDSDNDLSNQIAEYYFNKKHYTQAVQVFEELIKNSAPSAALYQKTGFSYQKNSQIEEALEAYLKADMIQPDDLWTVKKIAFCYRLAGENEKTLEQYRHADFLQPGQLKIRMNIAYCLILSEKYQDALKIYLSLEKDYPDNSIVWKAICWCAMLSENIFQAEYYIEKLLSDTPDAEDFLYAGHIAFCQKKRKEAVGHYLSSLSAQNNKIDLLAYQIMDDAEILNRNGISNDEISLLRDELYFLNEK